MPARRGASRNLIEFVAAWVLLKLLGLLPRGAAIWVATRVASLGYYLDRRLVRVANRNLEMAMSELEAARRRAIIKGVFRTLGRLLGEFSQFAKMTPDSIERVVVYDGFEHYQRAAEGGRGVLLLTGHIGAWELCAFAHGLYGHPLSFLVRRLDNPLLDRLINSYRELSGNRVIDKNNAVRAVLGALARGEDVGVLIDVNVLGEQGVFCDFFGIPACSTTGLAVFALRTDAPVVPGFLIWDESIGKHRLRFESEVPLIRTGDFKEEVALNTARFTKVIEEYARNYPDQWLWVHKRWNTRPEGEPDLYRRAGPAVTPGKSADLEARV